MSVLELHPESAPFVGKLFDTKLPRIGIFGESPYLPENKGSSFTLYPLIKYKEALLWVLEDKKEGGNYGFKKFNI